MAVFGLLSAVAGFVKVRYLLEKAIIDNIVFRAHYRITSAILFACCIIITANNLIGDPINCICDDIPSYVINTFCWISHTFTITGSKVANKVGTHVAHPGVMNEQEGERTYHSYYQWVPFVLFFQGVLFYTPHWIWKQWEDGKIRAISDGMRGVTIDSKAERHARVERIVQYIYETLHLHNTYAIGYIFCEVLNFVNVIGNIFMVDRFLGGTFMTYGLDVLSFSNMDQEDRIDPLIAVFPRVTKCTFYKYGSSGTIQKHDALCVLALNILNEKIYVFLWFWFVILAFMSGAALVYSMTLVLLPNSREFVLMKRFKFSTKSGANSLVRKTQIGDFLLLQLLGQNMNIMVFNELLDELVLRLNMGSTSSGASPISVPSAPSTLEMSPIYPEMEKFHRKKKDTNI